MRRSLILLLITILCFSQVSMVYAAPGGEVEQLAATRSVVLILAPYVTWEDIDGSTTPQLYQVIQNAPIGNLNARSRVKDYDGKPSLLEGALAISSGAWSRVDLSAREAYDVDEDIDDINAAEIYARLMGQSAGDASIVYLGLPRIIAANTRGDFTVIPGLLGSAIEDAGGVTAALGNSDLGFTSSAARQMRPAAIVVMDTEGTVALGSVSAELLTLDFTAPYGLRTDTDELYEQMRTLAPKLAANKPSLLVIDPGDLYRAQASRPESSILAAEANWNDALGTLDDIYAQASEIFADATIIVAAQAAVSPTLGREGLGPLIITQPSGADREEELVSSDANSAGQEGGLLSSDATQRAGLVTNLDLSATIYALLEIPAPLEVIGSPIYSRSTDIDRYEFLRRSNNTALSVDAMRARVINPIIWTTVILLCAGAFVLMWAQTHWRSSTIKRVRELLEIGILGCLSVPAASWFMFLIDRWPQSPNQVVAQLIAAAVVLWIVALIIWRLFGGTTGIIFLGAITSLVIIIDQLLGAPFSFSAIFSYSPIMAFRFYGLGNEGAALLFGASVMAFVLWLEQSAHPKRYTTWVLAIGAFLVMLVCAAPWWGANVGVAIWATVGFAVLFLLINDKKITWQNLLIMGIAIVLILGVFIALDRFGSGGETHLARAVDSAEQGGIAPLIEIVARKAQTNLRVLTASMWGVVFVAVIGFMLLMRFRPSPELTRTLEANRFFADGMTALLVAGIVAFFTEDSGIVLPAIMVLYLGGALLWLMLDRMNVEDLEGE